MNLRFTLWSNGYTKEIVLMTCGQTGEQSVVVDGQQKHGEWYFDTTTQILTITWHHQGQEDRAVRHVYHRVQDTNNWEVVERAGRVAADHVLMLTEWCGVNIPAIHGMS